MESKSIYEQIKSGKTPDELRKILENEISKAQAKISNETNALDDARLKMIQAVAQYGSLLGIYDEPYTQEDIQRLYNIVKASEKDLKQTITKVEALFKIFNIDNPLTKYAAAGQSHNGCDSKICTCGKTHDLGINSAIDTMVNNIVTTEQLDATVDKILENFKELYKD